MGYATDFSGQFRFNKPLSRKQETYLKAFSETRRMDRDPLLVSSLPDPKREAVGLPIGRSAEYFVGENGVCGQDRDSSILNYNDPPASQPGLWCKWIPTDGGDELIWSREILRLRRMAKILGSEFHSSMESDYQWYS